MTHEDQHTELKSMHTGKGKLSACANLAQTALNRPQAFGSVSQKPGRQLSKSLFSNEFNVGAFVSNEPNLGQSLLDRRHGPCRFSKNTHKRFTTCRSRHASCTACLGPCGHARQGTGFSHRHSFGCCSRWTIGESVNSKIGSSRRKQGRIPSMTYPLGQQIWLEHT